MKNLEFDLTRKKLPHFLFVGIQMEFIPDVLDFMEKHSLPVSLILPTHIRLGSIPGGNMLGQNPNTPIPIVHVYSKAPEDEWESRRKAFADWHGALMTERQKAGAGLVKVTEGQARASGLDLTK
jgi:hypothetical protein